MLAGMSETRTEHDTFGPIEVPAARLWGAQTQRSLGHFAISSERMPVALITALALVKQGALVGEDLAQLQQRDACLGRARGVVDGEYPARIAVSGDGLFPQNILLKASVS